MEPLMGDYTLFLGDCLEEMNRIEASSIDAIIADLPFGITANAWDFVIPFELLWTQFRRAIKRNGAIALFGAEPFASALRLSNPKWYRYDWIWEKDNGSDFLNVNRKPFEVHESIMVFYQRLPTYNPQMIDGAPYRLLRGKAHRSGLRQPNVADGTLTISNGQRYPRTVLKYATEKGLHPNQKPVTLLEYLIRTYTNPGELVLDCTMGSGTTGVACLHTGRRFIGIEKDPTYFETAKNRLQAEAAKLNNIDLPLFTEAIWNR